MIPAVIGLASGAVLLLNRSDDEAAPLPVHVDGFSTEEDGIEVPLALTRKQWLDFLRVSVCGNPRTVSQSFRLGTFGLTVRRLCDLGAMREPRVIHYQGRQVWDADWHNPKNLRAFQSSPMLQYGLFVQSIKDYFASAEVPQAVGQEIDGVKVTQSGALMLANRAGLPGIASWLESKEVRDKFSDNTTAFFRKANGIF